MVTAKSQELNGKLNGMHLSKLDSISKNLEILAADIEEEDEKEELGDVVDATLPI